MIKKVLLGLLGLIFLFIVGFYTWIENSWDRTFDVAYPTLKTNTDSMVIARGNYLVNGPAHCSGCHVGSYKDMIKSDQEGGVPLLGGVIIPIGPLGSMVT